MQDPDPPSSWKPHQSVVGGSIVGTSVAQIIIAGIQFYLHAALSPVTGGAVTTLCIFAATYFIPDNPNRQ